MKRKLAQKKGLFTLGQERLKQAEEDTSEARPDQEPSKGASSPDSSPTGSAPEPAPTADHDAGQVQAERMAEARRRLERELIEKQRQVEAEQAEALRKAREAREQAEAEKQKALEAKQKAKEEKERHRAERQEAKRKAAEEKARKKAERLEAKKQAAEERARLKAEKEAQRQKAQQKAEEEKERRRAEAEARRQEEERRMAEEQRAAEERARREAKEAERLAAQEQASQETETEPEVEPEPEPEPEPVPKPEPETLSQQFAREEREKRGHGESQLERMAREALAKRGAEGAMSPSSSQPQHDSTPAPPAPPEPAPVPEPEQISEPEPAPAPRPKPRPAPPAPAPKPAPTARPGAPLGAKRRGKGLDVTAVVLTFNGQRHLHKTMESLDFCDEILVVDSGSADASLDIAQKAGARILHRDWEGTIPQFKFAFAQVRTKWIITLDQDEWLDPDLERAVEHVLRTPGGPVGYFMNRRSWYLDRYLRHSGWYPDRLLRLFQKNAVQIAGTLPHEEFKAMGNTAVLPGDIIHHPYEDLSEHLRKIDAYTRDASRELARKGNRGGVMAGIGHGLAKFMRQYVLKLGFLDGRAGLVLAVHAFFYAFHKYVRAWERRGNSQNPDRRQDRR